MLTEELTWMETDMLSMGFFVIGCIAAKSKGVYDDATASREQRTMVKETLARGM